uniref:Lipocalin/cytosolic fatty-acid binding domain-containing protein n=1 Tax=Clastoptera arizonana TaxID=38151 RepID=A0A1B6DYL9_9HEMI
MQPETIAFLICCGTCLSQLLDPICPWISYKSCFNMTQFQGTWYQQAKFGSVLFGGLTTCGVLECEYDPEYDELYISYSSTVLQNLNQVNYSGDAVFRHTNKRDGVLQITWDYDPAYKQEPVTRLYIVETNYDDFAVLATCRKKVLSGWIVTRKQDFLLEEGSLKILENITKAMENVLNKGILLFDAQMFC